MPACGLDCEGRRRTPLGESQLFLRIRRKTQAPKLLSKGDHLIGAHITLSSAPSPLATPQRGPLSHGQWGEGTRGGMGLPVLWGIFSGGLPGAPLPRRGLPLMAGWGVGTELQAAAVGVGREQSPNVGPHDPKAGVTPGGRTWQRASLHCCQVYRALRLEDPL